MVMTASELLAALQRAVVEHAPTCEGDAPTLQLEGDCCPRIACLACGRTVWQARPGAGAV